MSELSSEDQAFVDGASAVALEVARRGLGAISDFMRNEATGRLSTAGDAPAAASKGHAQSEDQDLARAATDVLAEAGRRVLGATARSLTGRGPDRISDSAPRQNAVMIMQELGGLVTSILNESVGATSPSAPASPGIGADTLALSLDFGQRNVEFGLANVGLTPATFESRATPDGAPDNSAVTLQVTPLIGDTAVLSASLDIGAGAGEKLAQQQCITIQLSFERPPDEGLYHGYVYATTLDPETLVHRPLAVAALNVTVLRRDDPEFEVGRPAEEQPT